MHTRRAVKVQDFLRHGVHARDYVDNCNGLRCSWTNILANK